MRVLRCHNELLLLPAALLLLSAARPVVTAPQIPGSARCLVRGRIAIAHPKVKLHDGSADASGVAVWLNLQKGTPGAEIAHQPKPKFEQRDKRFNPHIMIVQVGTEVAFPNGDPFFHNVFSVFDGKTFDLGLYADGESRPVRFNRPGISFIYCNIHPQMSAVLVAVETPYFTISAQDGSFFVKDLPPGIYELHIWHERSDEAQLAGQIRAVSVDSEIKDLGEIRLDEAGYIPRSHKDKHGADYEAERGQSGYRRPYR